MTTLLEKIMSFLFIMFIVRNAISLIIIYMYTIARVLIKLKAIFSLFSGIISTIIFVLYCKVDINIIVNNKIQFIIYSIIIFFILNKNRIIERNRYINDYNNKYR